MVRGGRRPPRGENGTVVQWRRWMPGPRHGVARGSAVYGMPHGPDPGPLDELLGRCSRLRSWARTRGFVLSGVPADLTLLGRPSRNGTMTWRSLQWGPRPASSSAP